MSDHLNVDTPRSAPAPDVGKVGPPGHAATAQLGPSLGAEAGRAAAPDPRTAGAPPLDLIGRLGHRLFTWVAHLGVGAVALLGVVVAILMLGQYVFYRFTRSMTNDAFVESHIVNLSVQVEGLLTRVHVEEHDPVRCSTSRSGRDGHTTRRLWCRRPACPMLKATITDHRNLSL
jgi:hypothetical protein